MKSYGRFVCYSNSELNCRPNCPLFRSGIHSFWNKISSILSFLTFLTRTVILHPFTENTSPKCLTPYFSKMHAWRHPGRAKKLCFEKGDYCLSRSRYHLNSRQLSVTWKANMFLLFRCLVFRSPLYIFWLIHLFFQISDYFENGAWVRAFLSEECKTTHTSKSFQVT